MRVAVVYYPANHREKLEAIAKGLSQGIESQGHQVEVLDATRDRDKKLTMYEYLCIGSEGTGFFGGAVPPGLKEYLSGSGTLGGKRCFAYSLHKPFGSDKVLANIMKTMESEGMFLMFSEELRTKEEAVEIGKRLSVSSAR